MARETKSITVLLRSKVYAVYRCSNQPKDFLEQTLSSISSTIEPYRAISRMHAPVGVLLTLTPAALSLTLCAAQVGVPPSSLLVQLFSYAFGIFWLRGAACTVNDMWDVELDRQVERTKNRPLVKGDISMRAAAIWSALQISLAISPLFVIDWWGFSKGVTALILPVIYPLMKRYTWWPQLFLAVMIGYVPIMGSATLTGTTDWNVALPLCIATACWTVHYDTIYAHQDRVDDEKAGVYSTARLFGTHSKKILACFDVIAITQLCIAGFQASSNFIYFGGVAASACHLLWQLVAVDLDNMMSIRLTFLSNVNLGAILVVSSMLDYLLRNFGPFMGK